MLNKIPDDDECHNAQKRMLEGQTHNVSMGVESSATFPLHDTFCMRRWNMKKLLFIFFMLILTACNNQTNLDNKPNNQINDEADVIDIHGNVEHLDAMDKFVKKALNHKDATLRIVHYTVEGDPIYDHLTVNNQLIEHTYDTTEDSFGSGQVTSYTCEQLVRTETDTDLGYTLKGCTGENKEWEILHIAFNLPQQDFFGFILKYGVNEINEVNTIDHTLVKDLQNGETAILNDFHLTPSELQTIYKKLVLANYLGEKQLDTACNQIPHESYSLKVLINSGNREYRWSECDMSEDGKTLTEFLNVIKDIVSKRDDYKKLPDVKGAYE
jgi:hypothetical protein